MYSTRTNTSVLDEERREQKWAVLSYWPGALVCLVQPLILTNDQRQLCCKQLAKKPHLKIWLNRLYTYRLQLPVQPTGRNHSIPSREASSQLPRRSEWKATFTVKRLCVGTYVSKYISQYMLVYSDVARKTYITFEVKQPAMFLWKLAPADALTPGGLCNSPYPGTTIFLLPLSTIFDVLVKVKC